MRRAGVIDGVCRHACAVEFEPSEPAKGGVGVNGAASAGTGVEEGVAFADLPGRVAGGVVRVAARMACMRLELPGNRGEPQATSQEVFYGQREPADAGVSAGSAAVGPDRRSDLAGDRRGSGHRVIDADTLADPEARCQRGKRGAGRSGCRAKATAPGECDPEASEQASEPDQKTIRGAVFPPNGDILKNAAAFLRKKGVAGEHHWQARPRHG